MLRVLVLICFLSSVLHGQAFITADSLLVSLSEKDQVLTGNVLKTQLYDEKTALVLYKYEEGALHTFALSQEREIAIMLKDSIGLSKKITDFTSGLENGNPRNEEGDFLFAFLFPAEVQEVLINKDRLIIIPSGPLFHLPFEALPLNTEEYLIERYALSFISDPVSWCFSKSLSPKLKTKYTGFSPSYSKEHLVEVEGLTQYEEFWENADQSMDAEVKKTATSLNGTAFGGKNATETNFKVSVSNNRILHYKGTIFLDEEMPQESGFAFSGGDLTNSFLSFEELKEIEPENEFFFISADFYYKKKPEGKALAYLLKDLEQSRNQTCMLSLWPAKNQLGAKQIHAFMRQLEAATPRDIAYQKARLELLEKMGAVSLFQTNYQLYGEVEPLKPFGFGIPWYWLVGAGVIIAFVLMYFRLSSKKRGLEDTFIADEKTN